MFSGNLASEFDANEECLVSLKVDGAAERGLMVVWFGEKCIESGERHMPILLDKL